MKMNDVKMSFFMWHKNVECKTCIYLTWPLMIISPRMPLNTRCTQEQREACVSQSQCRWFRSLSHHSEPLGVVAICAGMLANSKASRRFVSECEVFHFPAGPDQGVDQSKSEIKGHRQNSFPA